MYCPKNLFHLALVILYYHQMPNSIIVLNMNLTSKRFKNAKAFAFVETLIEVCRSADQMLKEV